MGLEETRPILVRMGPPIRDALPNVSKALLPEPVKPKIRAVRDRLDAVNAYYGEDLRGGLPPLVED